MIRFGMGKNLGLAGKRENSHIDFWVSYYISFVPPVFTLVSLSRGPITIVRLRMYLYLDLDQVS